MVKHSLTIKDISRKAGVSYSTVAKVLNNHPGFNSATRKRILRIARDSGYRPNWLGKALRSGQSMTIGIAIYSRGSTISHLRSVAAESAASEKGYRSYLVHPENVRRPGQDVLVDLIDRRVDGLIVYAGKSLPEDQLAILEESSIAHVFVDHGPVSNKNVVRINREVGIKEVVQHLSSLGHKDVGLLMGTSDGSPDGKQGVYKKLLEEAGMDIVWTQHWDTGNDQAISVNSEAAYETIKNCLKSKDYPSAVIASNDGGAVAAMTAIQECGLKVPQDIAVVGFDGLELTRIVRPALTTVQQPGNEVGKVAFQMLYDLMNGRTIEGPVEFPCSLVVRESTVPSS